MSQSTLNISGDETAAEKNDIKVTFHLSLIFWCFWTDADEMREVWLELKEGLLFSWSFHITTTTIVCFLKTSTALNNVE